MSKPEKAAAQSAEAKTTESSLLDQIVEQGRFGKEQVARDRGRDMVKEFVAQVLEGEMKLSRDADATINARVAQIDHLNFPAIERNSASSCLSEAGSELARHKVPDGPERNQRHAQAARA